MSRTTGTRKSHERRSHVLLKVAGVSFFSWTLLLSFVALGTTPAAAAVGCSFDSVTASVTVTMGVGDATTMSVGVTGVILDDGTACGTATVNNTDTVTITGNTGNEIATISQSGGQFAPGKTPQVSGHDQIEFAVDLLAGSGDTLMLTSVQAVSNTITLGSLGINLETATPDDVADVTYAGVENITASGSDAGNTITGAGGAGTGSSIDLPLALNGGIGIDTLTGGTGNDALSGFGGHDTLDGVAGNDAFDGGTGIDTADYSADPSGVSVDLGTGAATDGYAGLDTISAVENVAGSASPDSITGDGNDNVLNGNDGTDVLGGAGGTDTLNGRAGDDILVSGAGNDALNGGAGADTAFYSADPSGVSVDLAAGTATDGFVGSDTLSKTENVTGSAFDDAITGDANDNVLKGGGGNDRLVGAAGSDTLKGGSGIDTVSYSPDPSKVKVKLGAGTATDGYGASDTLSRIENAIGSAFSDTIAGTGGVNSLRAGSGADTVVGGRGNDSISGGDGNDTLKGGRGNDLLKGGSGNDLLNGGSGNDTCKPGPGHDIEVSC